MPTEHARTATPRSGRRGGTWKAHGDESDGPLTERSDVVAKVHCSRLNIVDLIAWLILNGLQLSLLFARRLQCHLILDEAASVEEVARRQPSFPQFHL